jgi:PTH1 family peptidyl-tRNA hydrolase
VIRILAGLGNPGPEYEATRHNAGFWWIDALADRWKARLVPEAKHQALVARLLPPGAAQPVWLVKPMTFMNRSGVSVAGLARFYKIDPAGVLVVHDEMDLLPGQAKLKAGGSAGSNGVKDVQHMLGSGDFWRLRLGVGHPGVREEVVNHVLKKPSPTDRDAIQKAIEQSLPAVDRMLEGAMDKAVAIVHAQPPRPKPPKPPKPPPPPESPGAPPAPPGSASAAAGEGSPLAMLGVATALAALLIGTAPEAAAAGASGGVPSAASVSIWRCADAAGATTFSDRPCSRGQAFSAPDTTPSPAEVAAAQRVARADAALAAALRTQRLAAERSVAHHGPAGIGHRGGSRLDDARIAKPRASGQPHPKKPPHRRHSA